MAQLFRPRANAFAILIPTSLALVVVAGAIVAIALGGSPYATGVGDTPNQPVPFSHAHHAGRLGIDCRYCHVSVEESPFAGVPTTATCMTCHAELWTEAEMLEPIRASRAAGVSLRWARVHDLADFVYFDHRAHVANGVGCESCHGRVDRMPLTRQAEPLTMKWCLDCHRDPASALRPADAVTAMGWQRGEGDPGGEQLMAHYGIDADTLIECTTCHR